MPQCTYEPGGGRQNLTNMNDDPSFNTVADVAADRRKIGARILLEFRKNKTIEYLMQQGNLGSDRVPPLPRELAERIATIEYNRRMACQHAFSSCRRCRRLRCKLCFIGFATSGAMERSCTCEAPTRQSERVRGRRDENRRHWGDGSSDYQRPMHKRFPDLYGGDSEYESMEEVD
jgi:hypothetical protein